MARYILGKLQIKRLLEGKHVMDGHGRKFIADGDIKEYLQIIDKRDLYDVFEVIIEDGGLSIKKKV